jgi:hypothetical protein
MACEVGIWDVLWLLVVIFLGTGICAYCSYDVGLTVGRLRERGYKL